MAGAVRRLNYAAESGSDGRNKPTSSDIGKNSGIVRKPNRHALECLARLKEQRKIDPTENIETVVDEYAREHKGERGASRSYLLRMLNDRDKWETDPT